jgi:hypothetical protein
MEKLLVKDPKAYALKLDQQKNETAILEKLIIKLGGLLAIGFGEAGSEIIAANMGKHYLCNYLIISIYQIGQGEVNPMIPGKKMMAIFGFCDIRNFTDATEVLQTQVMMFVNEIAQITHGTVDQFCGNSNKNIGDAFLLVWTFKEGDYHLKDGEMVLKVDERIRKLSDLPVLCFIKIAAYLALSHKLMKYNNHPGLNKRLENYSVKMGFGLHVGWAIEVYFLFFKLKQKFKTGSYWI